MFMYLQLVCVCTHPHRHVEQVLCSEATLHGFYLTVLEVMQFIHELRL